MRGRCYDGTFIVMATRPGWFNARVLLKLSYYVNEQTILDVELMFFDVEQTFHVEEQTFKGIKVSFYR